VGKGSRIIHSRTATTGLVPVMAVREGDAIVLADQSSPHRDKLGGGGR
jgi:hypothetical protein